MPTSPLRSLPIDVSETLVRVFGSVQAQTQTALIFDDGLRRELFSHGAEFRWVCEVLFDSRAGTDALLLTPANVALSALLKASSGAAGGFGASPEPEAEGGDGLVYVGTLFSDWVDADGTEDPVKWVQRTTANPGGSLTSAPHSMPIAFGSAHPSVRIAAAAAKGADGTARALRARQRLADEAGVDVSELGADSGSPSPPSTAQRPPSAGAPTMHVEPALRCPLQLRTYIQMCIPSGPTERLGGGAFAAGDTTTPASPLSHHRPTSPTTEADVPTSPTAPNSSNNAPFIVASLPYTTTFVPCTTDLAIRPLVIKTQLTRRDVLVGLRSLLRPGEVFDDSAAAAAPSDSAPSAPAGGSRPASAIASVKAAAANPYAVDEGPLEGEEGGDFGYADAAKRQKRPPSGKGRGKGAAAGGVGGPRSAASPIDYDALDLTSEDADTICGHNNIRVTFADLSIAIAPIVAVRPDATTVTSSTALLPAASSADRDRITAEALGRDLLRCQFLDIKSIVPAKVLEWSLAPRTITYGCMPLTDLYAHFVFFYAIAAVNLASLEALRGNAKKAPVRPYRPLVAQLAGHAPSRYRDPISGAYRWDTLTSLSLFHYILGDTNVLPVLSLLLCCRGVEFADFNTNALTTLSMKRLVEVFRRHPSIRTLDLSGNTFFESAGDEMLRLALGNKGIVGIACGSNHFSERLHDRIQRQVAQNAALLRADPMNFLSPDYSYLRSSTDIPAEAWLAVHERWITLIAAPLDVHPRNVEERKKAAERGAANASNGGGAAGAAAAAGDAHEYLSRPATAVVAAPKSLVIPLSAEVPAAVAAPLFAEAMRHVQIEVLSRLTQDRIIRGLFRDFAAHQGRHLLEVDLPTLQEIEKRGVAPDGALGMPRYSRSYAKMLVTALNATLGAAAKSADDRQIAWRDTVRLLQGLGEAQFDLGCRPWHLMFANRAFMEWLVSVLGPTMMDPVTQACWAQVLALISRAIVSGTPLPSVA